MIHYQSCKQYCHSLKNGKLRQTIQKRELLTKEAREDIKAYILGLLAIVKQVSARGISVKPGYVNSDLVENFFCQQRGLRNGMCTNPTIAQYGPGVNAIVLGTTSVSRKSNTGGAKAQHSNVTTCKPLNKRKRFNLRM
jgi:hypothetical protein